MKKHTSILTTILVLVWNTSFSQFQEGIGDPNSQIGKSVQHTVVDNGYIAAGTINNSSIFGQTDATVTKTDAAGNVIWSTVYGGPLVDDFNSIREVSTGGAVTSYVAAGSTNSFGFGGPDMYLVGLSNAGVPTFSRTFGGTGLDKGYCVQRILDPQSNPGYVIVGETNSFPNAPAGVNVFVVRTDLTGNPVDQVVLGTPGDDRGYWIEQTLDGGYILAGVTNKRCLSDTIRNSNIYVARLDRFFNPVWGGIFAGPGSLPDLAFCVRENPLDGTFIVTGDTKAWGRAGETFLLNLSPAGAFNWMNLYGGGRTDKAFNVMYTNDLAGVPQYIVSGYTNSSNPTGNNNPLTFKTDIAGNLIWTKTYGGPSAEFAYEIDNVPSTSGAVSYVLTGSTLSYTSGNNDILLIEMDNVGFANGFCEKSPVFLQKAVVPCISSGCIKIHVTPFKNVNTLFKFVPYVTTACTVPSPRIAGTSDADDLTLDNAEVHMLHLTPNPASSVLNISFDPSCVGGKISIVNNLGNVVIEKNVESENTSVNVENLAPGMYIVRIVNSTGKSESAKFNKN